MSSTGHNTSISTIGSTQDNRMTLPTHRFITGADDTRILVAKRRRALDKLNLPDDVKGKIEKELDRQGWLSYLASNEPRAVPMSKRSDTFSKEDTRALLCFKRHCPSLNITIIRDTFFWSQGVAASEPANSLNKKLETLRDRDMDNWNESNDAMPERFYDEGRATFDAMAESNMFGDFSVLELETRYGQIKIKEAKGEKDEDSKEKNKRRWKGKRKGKRKGKKVQSKSQAKTKATGADVKGKGK
ncbi:hypothetical protein CC86DRAFT_47339 [Ophiobolus disseminans]|uniref:Uncharacterized protein n=1 Tax=Ophiobolus disseminans TaxID=1469910 RepID=A0A6A6ZWG3_9PLEO|nr:hypothetical protein CC86DRAFT_47339 [Ophiobolus disseminans]